MQLPFRTTKIHSSIIQPIFLLGTAIVQLLLLLLTCFTGIQLTTLAHKPAPTLVQMTDGRVLQVAAAQANHRDPAVVNRLVQEWATLTLNCSGKLPNGQPDPGIKLKNSVIPTSAWEASFVLSEDYRRQFMQFLAQLFPRGLLQSQVQTVLKIESLSAPKAIAPGQWQIDLVSTLLLFRPPNLEGEPISFNKRIFLRAVPQPLYPLPEAASAIQQAVYRLRQAGLEINQIQNLTL